MRIVDFSTVINIIIENCRENMHTKKNRERPYSELDLICDMFYDFYTECDETCFDNTSVSRWIKGNRPVSAPCRFFCGRDTELNDLHTALQEHNKVFISGFAGIGKSEFAKCVCQVESA